MKNITIELYESKKEYGKKLAYFLGREKDSPFIVKLFLDHPAADSGDPGDIAAVSSDLWPLYRETFRGRSVVILDEDGTCSEQGIKTIYKYQSARKIYRLLLDCSLEQKGQSGAYVRGFDDEFELISIFTPCPTRESSEQVLSMCADMNASARILYLNFEPVSAFWKLTGRLFPSEDDGIPGEELSPDIPGMSELLYYIRQYHGNIGPRIQTLALKGIFDFLMPPENTAELPELTAADWNCLIDSVRDDTGYQCLVLDFGASLPPKAAALRSSSIRVISSGTVWEEILTDRFREIMILSAEEISPEKISICGIGRQAHE
ncbi:MAG: hypothetical protein K5637_06015 [Lachnospiraceae bacterium]|nr:hypothetical protein [Lachnospiraceae bacterium]